MNSENQEIHERGDSDDEIAELRFQALLTKKENEAEVSPAHKPMPVNNSLNEAAINQPLSNFRGQPFNYRGRGGSHYYNKPYLHTFSQQIASKSVNSNNIVVLTSSDPDDLKPSFGSEWSASVRGSYIPRGGWPRGRGRGRGDLHPSSNSSMPGTRQAPPLILPQDKYAPQPQNTQEPEQNKHKLSARMRRLQGSDSDSEDSESDSSDDSSSNTSSSDSNSSSSDSSSSDSDSDSDTGQTSPVKKIERGAKKVESGKHSVQTTAEHSGSNSHNHSASKNVKSPIKSSSKQVQPSESNKTFHSTFGKESSRSPADRRPGSPKQSHSLSKSPSYSQKPKSPPPVRLRRSISTSPQPRRRSRSPLRRSRTPIRRYGSRSPPRYRGSNSPRNPKSPRVSKSPIGRYRSLSRSPYYESKRFRSRSPYIIKRALSPPLRRSSRSPLPPRRFSRSPIAGRLRSRSPKRYSSRSPKPMKRCGSLTPPPHGRSYRSKSPYSVRRYGSRSPRPYPKRISPGSPRRYRSISPRNARSPFRKEILPKSSRVSRRSSFSPPAKRYGSRSPSTRGKEPLRGNRSPLFQPRGRTPVGGSGISSPQRIKRIGSLSPKPLLDTQNKFVRGQSPYRNFPRSPPVKRYGTPPPKRLSPDFKMAKHLPEAVDPKDEVGGLRPPFARAVSPHRHNYVSRSPSPYFKNRLTPPGLQAVERNFPAGSQSPVFYGGGMHGKMNRNIPYEKEVGPLGKRFPGEHPSPPPWLSHKSEMGLPPKEPPLHHYPPKFMDTEYGDRAGYLQHPPPQLLEKPWNHGPPGRGLGHFGNGRGHPRLERHDVGIPQHMVMERGRGRGGRGMRGQRGGMRGVHARLQWNSQHQVQPPLYDLPPPHFDDPYIREKPLRVGMPPPLLEPEIAYFDRKQPQPFDNVKPPLLPFPTQKGLSPGRLRIPRGPKTPPYSPPNRDTSPVEWEKRPRSNAKPRTPSSSPSPHRYGNEGPMLSHFKSREHIDISDSRSHSENIGSHKPPHYRSRSPYVKDEQLYGGAHGHRIESRKESNMREMDDRKKMSHSRGEDHKYKGRDIRRAYSNEDLSLNSNEKLRDRDRRIDERHRSPLPPRAKGSESYNTRNKDYETDFKKERDIRGRRETVEQKGRREHEDQRGRRDTEEHTRRRDDEQRIKKEIVGERIRRESGDQKGRREIENSRVRRESGGDLRGRKEHSELRNRKEVEEHHKTRKIEEERKERRELEDNRGTRDDYELSSKRHLDLEDNLKKVKVKKEDEKIEKDERKKDNRGEEVIKKEKINLRYDRKEDVKEFDKLSNKSYDKHSELRHRDDKRGSKEIQENSIKKKEIKEPKEKVSIKAGQEEKKKKKKKHKDEDRSSSKSSKKKKKEKKKKKDSKKQKKKSKEFEDEDFTKRRKKTLDHSSSSRDLNRPDEDLRHILVGREDISREKGSFKRKDTSSAYDTDDRESRKRRKDVPSSGKDDWKWRGGSGHGGGRDIERRKEERGEPIPKERNRIFSSSEKRGSDPIRGGKGFFVTVNSSSDRRVSSNKDIGKKDSGSRLPVHMRLGSKTTADKTPLKANSEGMKGDKKVQRMGENIGSLGRRKVGGGAGGGPKQQHHHSHRRQGMKGGGMGAAKRNNR